MNVSPFHFGTIRVDPLSSYSLSFSEDCMAVENRGTHFEHACASFGISSGTWYWEVQSLTTKLMQIGVICYDEYEYIDFGDYQQGQGVGDLPHSWSVDLVRRVAFAEGSQPQPFAKNSSAPCKVGSIIGFTLNIEAGTLSVSLDGKDLGVAHQGIKIPPGRSLRPAISIPSEAKGKFIFLVTKHNNLGLREFGSATRDLSVPSTDAASLEALPCDTLKLILSNIHDSSALALLSTNRRFSLLARTDFTMWKDVFLSTWMARYPDTRPNTMPIKHILDERMSNPHSKPIQHWQFDEMRQAAKDLLNDVFLFSSNCAYGDIYCTNLWKGPGFASAPAFKNSPDLTSCPGHSSILIHDGQRAYMRKYTGYAHPKIAFAQRTQGGNVEWKFDPAPSEACPVAVDPLRRLVFISHADTKDISLRNGVNGEELSRVHCGDRVAANQYGIYVQSTKKMYVIGDGKQLICIEAADPRKIRLLWSESGNYSYGQGGLVFTHSGAIVMCNNRLRAFDPLTGRLIWTSQDLPHSQCLATCDRTTGLLITPSNTENVSAIDPFTGKFAWTHKLPESICYGFGSVASHPNGSFYFISSAWGQPPVMIQLDSATGAEIRRIYNSETTSFSSSCQVFLDSHGRVYAFDSRDITCFDEKLEPIWVVASSGMDLGTEAAFVDPCTLLIKRRNDSGGVAFFPKAISVNQTAE